MYQITGLLDFPDDIDQIYEDPRLVAYDLSRLSISFPSTSFTVLRDGTLINESQLAEDIKNFEIHSVMHAAERLPAGYRRGWGTESDDVSSGVDGPKRVWRPTNPDDQQ